MPVWGFLSLGALVAWAVWGVFMKMSIEKIGWFPAAIGSISVEFAFLLLLLPWVGRLGKDLPLGIGYAIASGTFGVIGLVLFNQALEKGHLSTVSPITSLYPVLAALLGVVLFNEPLTMRLTVGIALAALAVFTIVG